MQNKKGLAAAISFFSAIVIANLAYGHDGALWEQYKSNFISNDGRIIDSNCDKCSHSEGQGYGMLLAVSYDDRIVFDKIWQWTKKNLGVRADSLFAWQWGKRPNGQWEVIDYNNASDGDILIGYALLKGSAKWSDSGYRTEGLKIVEGIRKKLALHWQGHTFILPSYYGFIKENGFVINPSYLIPSAFSLFAKEDERLFWENVYKDSLFIMTQSCVTKPCLPPDWVLISKDKMSVFTEKSPYFGYEAIRTLIYFSFEKAAQFPDGVSEILGIYRKLGYVPLWVDLERNSFSLKSAPAGFYAAYSLASSKAGDKALGIKLSNEAREKLASEKDDYYSFSLYLLANCDALQ